MGCLSLSCLPLLFCSENSQAPPTTRRLTQCVGNLKQNVFPSMLLCWIRLMPFCGLTTQRHSSKCRHSFELPLQRWHTKNVELHYCEAGKRQFTSPCLWATDCGRLPADNHGPSLLGKMIRRKWGGGGAGCGEGKSGDKGITTPLFSIRGSEWEQLLSS